MNSNWIYEVDQSWTLFLDRDGVLNKRAVGSYIMRPDDLEMLPGVLEALYDATFLFNRIVVVTNQQGIGKELYTHQELALVHETLLQQVENAHGRIDQIYYSPDLSHLNSSTRKPAPGMAFQAQQDFPDISFKKSVVVGDSQSDITFGNNLGMKTVYVNHKDGRECRGFDIVVASLKSFIDRLKL